jgi:hypothetical protein
MSKNSNWVALVARWILATLIYLGIACILAAAAAWFIAASRRVRWRSG